MKMEIEIAIKPREKKLSDFLPPRIINELREKHCRVEIVDSLPNDAWGSYDPDEDVIRLSASSNWEKVAEAKARAWEITVEKEAAFVAVIFHELYHFEHRRDSQRIREGGRSLGQLLAFKRELDIEAEAYAANRFFSWKMNYWEQGDFVAWKAKCK